LLGVELVLLSANLIFIFGSFIQNDPQGFMYVLCILTVSAVETGLGVAVLVFAYGKTIHTNYTKLNTLKN
jgi:NADH:ubiquinone oxidoreductase subunit K